MSEGVLYVCGTPLGNLGDVSDRLRDVLESVDIIYAEDTRRTSKLTSHLRVATRLRSMYLGNENSRTEELLESLRSGRSVALVSDAGMPTVSDPGARAVDQALEAGFRVVVIPGPSAVTAAIALSGFDGDRFVFEGFLPRKGGERRRRLESLGREDRAIVLFATPHRLTDDLRSLEESLGGDRRISVSRELTKLHEEVWRGTLSEALKRWAGDQKGEFTLVVEQSSAEPMGLDEAVDLGLRLTIDGMSHSDAASQAAQESGVSKRLIYQGILDAQV